MSLESTQQELDRNMEHAHAFVRAHPLSGIENPSAVESEALRDLYREVIAAARKTTQEAVGADEWHRFTDNEARSNQMLRRSAEKRPGSGKDSRRMRRLDSARRRRQEHENQCFKCSYLINLWSNGRLDKERCLDVYRANERFLCDEFDVGVDMEAGVVYLDEEGL